MLLFTSLPPLGAPLGAPLGSSSSRFLREREKKIEKWGRVGKMEKRGEEEFRGGEEELEKGD